MPPSRNPCGATQSVNELAAYRIRRLLALFPIPQGAISSGELRKIGYFHSGGFKYLRYELSRIDLIAARPLRAYIYPVIWSRGLQVALSLAPVRDGKKVAAKLGANGKEDSISDTPALGGIPCHQ